MSLASLVNTLAGRVATEFNTLRGEVASGLAGKVGTSDARLSDARTPTAHKSTHAAGGSDALAPADIGAATSGHTHSPSAVYAAPRNGGTVSTATNVDGTVAGDAYYVVTGNVTFTPTGTPAGRRMTIKAQASGGSRTPTLASSVALPTSGGPTARNAGALASGTIIEWAVEYCPLKASWVLNAMAVY